MPPEIIVRGARLHNLKNITVHIPKDRLVVLTGVSGSGKSTLGFDILHREGQRQYLESFGLLPYGFARLPVDSISGLSPTISLDQRLTNHSPRSTVGTATDVYTTLRLLYARLGRRPCPACGRELLPSFDPSRLAWGSDAGQDEDAPDAEEAYPCPHCSAPVPELSMGHFSFNKPAGACPTCTGLGSLHQADLTRLVDEQKSLAQGAVFGWDGNLLNYHSACLLAAAAHYGFEFDLTRPVVNYTPPQRDLLYHGVESPQFRRHFPHLPPPDTVRRGRFEGLATSLLRRYAARIQDPYYRDKMQEFLLTRTCPDCQGARLRPESRAVTVQGQPITALAGLPLAELGRWLAALPETLGADEHLVAAPVLAELANAIARLVEAGAGYLALERAAPSLSAGEAQRLRLASLLGSGLSGVLYIFDEPTIGLHPRDTRRLVGLLRRLRDLGNTVLVIEHDLELIRSADHVIDFGPGGGTDGGQVVACGAPQQVAAQPASLTGDYLAGRRSIPLPQKRRLPGDKALVIRGARHHNLQDLTLSIPLGLLVAVTGVSGSGKSSLIFDTLGRALRQRLHGGREAPGEHEAIDGLEHLAKVVLIDQAQLGRGSRSNLATYADVFTPIRQTFAAAPEARQLGLAARHFSFNLPGGRCERCQGAGVVVVSMHFLPDVEVTCPLCRGRRFTPPVLQVRYREHDIAQVLDLTVEEALDLFSDLPATASPLRVMAEIGLGYLQLGQPAATLSGGEAQRLKLAKELGRRLSGRALYLLDEPTTGLHMADTARLLAVLQRLVDSGNTVVVVEHNLELAKAADWVIDLGPEGGAAGGRLVAQGTPEQVAATPASFTGQVLREIILR